MTIKKRIIGFMNSYSNGISGGDFAFIKLCRQLIDFQLTIVSSKNGVKLCKEFNVKSKFIQTSKENFFNNPVLIYLLRIFHVISCWKIIIKNDIIISSSDFFPDVLPAFIIKIYNPKTIWIQHIFHIIPRNRYLTYIGQLISFLFIRAKADLIVVDNEELKLLLGKTQFKMNKISVNYLGVDHKLIANFKNNKRKEFDGIYLGRIHKSKGILELIDIWKIVVDKIPKAKLIIVGGGNESIENAVKSKINSNNLENNIHYIGYLNHNQALQMMGKSKIFIFPSTEEGFGISLLEAQALGLPIVAWNLSIYKEIYPHGMIRIDKRNITLFAQEIYKILNDSNKYHKLSLESIMNSKKYSWNKFVRTELNFIKKYY